MTEQEKQKGANAIPKTGGQEGNIPDEERRKILGKLVKVAFVAPMVMLVLEGGDSITYGY